MNIETPDELVEALADAIGIYGGACANQFRCGEHQSIPMCCRPAFVLAVTDRIRKSVENEQLIARLGADVFDKSRAARGGE